MRVFLTILMIGLTCVTTQAQQPSGSAMEGTMVAYFMTFMVAKDCAAIGAGNFTQSEVDALQIKIADELDRASVPQSERDRVWEQANLGRGNLEISHQGCMDMRTYLQMVVAPEIFTPTVPSNPF